MSIFDATMREQRCERIMNGVYTKYGPYPNQWPHKAHRAWLNAAVRKDEANDRWHEDVGQHITITFAPLDGRAA